MILIFQICKLKVSNLKIVIYTCLTNQYDNLSVPEVVEDNIDYIAFTDHLSYPLQSPWAQRNIEGDYRNPRVQSRHPKINPHLYLQDYDVSVYVDAMFLIKGGITNVVKEVLRRERIGFFKHPERDCIFNEAEAIKHLGKDVDATVNNQMIRYRKLCYPENNGLIAGGFIVREHNNTDVKKTMSVWWEELLIFSQRDQLSCNFALWKKGLSYYKIPGVYWDNKYIVKTSHSRINNYVANRNHVTPSVQKNDAEKYYSKTTDVESRKELDECKTLIANLKKKNSKMRKSGVEKDKQLRILTEKYEKLIKMNRALAVQNKKILHSTSWRLSAPIRRLKSIFSKSKGGGRRS